MRRHMGRDSLKIWDVSPKICLMKNSWTLGYQVKRDMLTLLTKLRGWAMIRLKDWRVSKLELGLVGLVLVFALTRALSTTIGRLRSKIVNLEVSITSVCCILELIEPHVDIPSG